MTLLKQVELSLHHIEWNLQKASLFQFWSSMAVLAFAIAFLVVGVARTVEFDHLGLSRFRKTTLITFHILGCGLLTAAFFLLAVDFDKSLQRLTGALLLGALMLLFPVHIYIGILRRIALRPQT